MASMASSIYTIDDSSDVKIKSSVSPLEIEKYLPWAYKKFAFPGILEVCKKNMPNTPTKSLTKPLKGTSKSQNSVVLSAATLLERETAQVTVSQEIIKITTIYSRNKLTQIKFMNNRTSNLRKVLQILALIMKYHPLLRSIFINKSLTKEGIVELANILLISNITELILDDTFVPAANYHILLDYPNNLNRLSLARCQLQDEGLKPITEKLTPPHAASHVLAILDLSSNSITDVGATYLSNALKTNKRLNYLNLASNCITDDGANAILNTLKRFALNKSDKEVHDAIMKKLMIKRLNIVALQVKRIEANRPKLPWERQTKSSLKLKSTSSFKTMRPPYELFADFNEAVTKAVDTAISMVKDEESKHIVVEKGVQYNIGNNTLTYLNLSYNSLTDFILDKLLEVLRYQKTQNWEPKGLVMVKLEGNPLPVTCEKLTLINKELNISISSYVESKGTTSSKSNSSFYNTSV